MRHLTSKKPPIGFVVAWLIPSNPKVKSTEKGWGWWFILLRGFCLETTFCMVAIQNSKARFWRPSSVDNKWFQYILWVHVWLYSAALFGTDGFYYAGQAYGVLEVVYTSGLVRVTRKHKFMEQVYSQVNLIVEYVEQLNWSLLLYAWCIFSSNQPQMHLIDFVFWLFMYSSHFHVSFQCYISCLLTF